MTNGEWLDYLAHNAPDELAAWFDAERITNQAEMLHMPEPHESATMQQIRQVIEDTVKRGVYGDTESENADSRERLEADMRELMRSLYEIGYTDAKLNYGILGEETRPRLFIFDEKRGAKFIELLDRQAAITLAKDEAYCQECNGDYYKLQDERDELQAQVDAKDNCIENIMQTLHETQARASNLADDLLTANRQREQYRKLFGMALDWAHEITMLESSIDEGMA